MSLRTQTPTDAIALHHLLQDGVHLLAECTQGQRCNMNVDKIFLAPAFMRESFFNFRIAGNHISAPQHFSELSKTH